MTPHRIALVGFAAAMIYAAGAAAAEITGAGATFPYPIYAKWAEAYAAKTGIKVNYQSIGSGGGIRQIVARTVAFGASDMPLKPDVLARDGLMQFPTVMGGVVPVVNLKGIGPGRLKLDGKTLAGIYLGTIAKWNDPAIAALNPGLSLPDEAVAPVHRSDGSGTNFIFTHYLSSVDPEFASQIGENTAVEFPSGIGAKGNEGVAAVTARTEGAIGYVEFAYAVQNKMPYVLLRNTAGAFVAPDSKAFEAAAANADWSKAPGFYLLLTGQPGAASWPITGATFILLRKDEKNPDTARQVIDFFDWAYHNGAELARSLDYVPMPASVVKLVEEAWRREIKSPDGKPVWTGPGVLSR
ncbi:MAG TPA: phosphate ABC transporter substrate-binding protein PstS [Stellaceae bacterium]